MHTCHAGAKHIHEAWEVNTVVGRMMASHCLTEIPLRMTLTLRKVTSANEIRADFTCMLSKVDLQVSWFKEEEKIVASPKHELVDEGRMHQLLVHDLCVDDYADYLVVIGSRRMTGLGLKEGWLIVIKLLYVFLVERY